MDKTTKLEYIRLRLERALRMKRFLSDKGAVPADPLEDI